MATIVNNPTPQNESGGTGFLIGAMVLVTFLGILLYFGLPILKNLGPMQVNVPAPVINVPAPQVNVPAPVINVPAQQ